MASSLITPVIICGGSGTRLWPLSRESQPKQFIPLGGDTSSVLTSAVTEYIQAHPDDYPGFTGVPRIRWARRLS